jgi:transcriptional regulator with XRE-family HTH domain
MAVRARDLPHYPRVEAVIDAIADWVKRYRQAAGQRDQFAQCDPAEIRNIAGELGISTRELQDLSRNSPDSADDLKRMLVALGVDPNRLSKLDGSIRLDLQRLCASCDNKRRCRRELASGTAAAHYPEFCPNAFTLDALFGRNQFAPKEEPTPDQERALTGHDQDFPPSYAGRRHA